MRFKHIAGGLGLVGFGAMWGWAITADHWDEKTKSKHETLAALIARKNNDLKAAQSMLEVSVPVPVEERPESSSEQIARLAAENAHEALILPDDATDEQAEAVAEAQMDEYQDRRLDELLKGQTPEETRSNLRKLIDDYVDPDSEDSEAFVQMASQIVEEPAMSAPFVIKASDYAWDEEGANHEKSELKWFPRDRILLDEDEEPIDNKDIDMVVGWANLNRFGDQSNADACSLQDAARAVSCARSNGAGCCPFQTR